MTGQSIELDEALKSYNRAADQESVELAEQVRREVVDTFPLDAWHAMPLDRYALGQGNTQDTFCWRIEFGTPHVGSIRRGSARKHLIYRQSDGKWYFYRQSYKDESDAW